MTYDDIISMSITRVQYAYNIRYNTSIKKYICKVIDALINKNIIHRNIVNKVKFECFTHES